MGLVSKIKKTYYYGKRNGFHAAYAAAREALGGGNTIPSERRIVPEAELEAQAKWSADYAAACDGKPLSFSIVVPAYETPKEYLEQLIVSVLSQTYPYFELIIADASATDSVKKICDSYTAAHPEAKPERMVYHRLANNEGIAQNTNGGIELATGDYIGLLDHDDYLEPDALYYYAREIYARREALHVSPVFLYCDEDKCNSDASLFFDLSEKTPFDAEYLLSNNYVCHFLVMESGMIRKLRLRGEYNGAQDFDLVLRAAREAGAWSERNPEIVQGLIAHIPETLYHWRCHEASTADNPQSKAYAYEAGLRAVDDLIKSFGWKAHAEQLRHVGFYRVVYDANPFEIRETLGCIGGRVLSGNGRRVIGGLILEDKGAGEPDFAEGYILPYDDLDASFSGYLHRASLTQSAEAVDLRCLRLRPELHGTFEEIVGVPYTERKITSKEENAELLIFDYETLPDAVRTSELRLLGLSLELGKRIRELGYTILYDPKLEERYR